MIYANGERLLTESDNRLNWNLLTGTNQTFKNYLIPKGSWWNGTMILNPVPFTGWLTFSAFVENNSDQTIYLRGDGKNGANSSPIEPHQAGHFFVTNEFDNNGGLYFSMQSSTNNTEKAQNDLQFEVKELKLEFGKIATPWMPSLSDLVFKNQN